MQRMRISVDQVHVQSLGMWLVVITGVGLGLGIGSPLTEWIVVPVTLAAVGLGLAARGGRRRRLVFGVSLALLGLARGASIRPSSPVEADRRGFPPPTRLVFVEGASTPGPHCRVSARTARGIPVELALPSEACPLWWGVSVLVPSEDLYTDAARRSPDGGTRVFVSHSWRRPDGTSEVIPWWSKPRAIASAALAHARQAGWEAARGDPARAFVVASSLGLSDALPPEVRATLQRAGLGHLVAVSGLHVGLAALAWLAALRWLLATRWWGARASVALSTVPVLAYVVLTGAAAPAVRAALMFGLVALGSVLGRPTHGPSVLLVAATLMAFAQPHWLVEPGFQLSVAAMVVLVGLPSGVGVSFTSWHLGWALLPLLWLHFDASSDGSVVANAIAMPVFALWVVPTAVVGWGLLPVLGPHALGPAAAGAAVILDVADLVSTWPEIPRGVWVAAAVMAWVPHVRRRLSDRGRAWLPHRGAALLLILVAVWSSRPRTPRPGWTAWSAGRHPEVMAVGSDGLACVREPSRGAGIWRERLAASGAVALAGMQLSSGLSVDDPATQDWLRHMGRPASRARGAPRCTLPDRDVVLEALVLCSAYSPAPAARRREAGSLQCWSARLGAWRSAPIHSP